MRTNPYCLLLKIIIFVVVRLKNGGQLKHRILQIWLFVCFFISVPYVSLATDGSIGMKRHREPVDSILDSILCYSSRYEKIIGSYNAELYIKRSMQVKKNNFLLYFAPYTLRQAKKVKNNITESLNELHYTFPNIYDQKVKAIYGNNINMEGISNIMAPYFHINVYSSSTLLYNKLISQLALNARNYYTYKIDSVFGTGDSVRYKIRIIPKNLSYQLVSGYMVVSDQSWKVRELYLEGRSEYMRYNVKIVMGKKGNEEYLPIKYEIDVFVNLLGNVIDINFTARLTYQEIQLTKPEFPRSIKSRYNLTEAFSLSCNKDSCITDSVQFARLRPLPLSNHEKLLYRDYAIHRDSLYLIGKAKKRDLNFWGQTGEFLLSSYILDFSSMGNVKFSPIINPFLLSYNHIDGFSYRQEFKYNRLFADDRLLRVVPKMGYNFKRSEFYWGISSDYDYCPAKRASIHVSFGNGNRIYSSKVVESIKNIPDSLFNFDELNLDYFKDLYFDINHSQEVMNGLFIKAGFTIHQRDAVKPSKIVVLQPMPPSKSSEDLLYGLKTRYVSFAPRLQVSWTPGQYYYLKGKRKINLNSKYPTFSFDYERGIKGVMNSTGRYERIELDMQHHISLGLMRDIYYRAGTGAFTNTHEFYFVDYANLSKHNLPVGWYDDIGGVFQLLDGRWYNSSKQYLRAHFTYQAPFMWIRHLKKYTSYVTNERIYVSALSVPHLNPYIELGYGIGTHVFDAGLFVNFEKTSFKQIGFKFTFELFNR